MADASSNETHDVGVLVKRLAAPTGSLSLADERMCCRLLESGKEALRQLAVGHIQAAGQRPVLVSYSSGGTPVQHTQRLALAKVSAAALQRKMGEGDHRVPRGAGLGAFH